jgi:hypothetical protein
MKFGTECACDELQFFSELVGSIPSWRTPAHTVSRAMSSVPCPYCVHGILDFRAIARADTPK